LTLGLSRFLHYVLHRFHFLHGNQGGEDPTALVSYLGLEEFVYELVAILHRRVGVSLASPDIEVGQVYRLSGVIVSRRFRCFFTQISAARGRE
jgi:hypothetical protein